MDEITLSRNYRAVWADARKKNTFEALEKVFDDLANEIGMPDAERLQINETAATAAALRKNAQETPGIKRQV
jgi:hypothetical protein